MFILAHKALGSLALIYALCLHARIILLKPGRGDIFVPSIASTAQRIRVVQCCDLAPSFNKLEIKACIVNVNYQSHEICYLSEREREERLTFTGVPCNMTMA